MNCEKCNHVQEKHLEGKYHCREIIELIPQNDTPFMLTDKDGNDTSAINAHRLCDCREFVGPYDAGLQNL